MNDEMKKMLEETAKKVVFVEMLNRFTDEIIDLAVNLVMMQEIFVRKAVEVSGATAEEAQELLNELLNSISTKFREDKEKNDEVLLTCLDEIEKDHFDLNRVKTKFIVV